MSIVIESPQLEHGQDEGVVSIARPKVSWVVRTEQADWFQTGAEIALELSDGSRKVSPVESGDSVLVEWPFEDLTPRQRGEVRVRVRDGEQWSQWSSPTAFTATFLGDREWHAEFIGLAAPTTPAQTVQLRREFTVGEGLERATLYATAHGVYQAWANGTEVDDEVLKPGWTPYQFRLVHETSDVTAHLSQGSNVLAVALSGGWFTERYGFQGQADPFYGEQPSFAGQLLLEYADGTSEWISTDQTWRITGDGPWLAAGIYLGEDYDASRAQEGWTLPGFDDSGWEAAQSKEPGVVPGARTSPPARRVQEVPVAQVLTSPSGKTLLDFGQNLVGRLRIRVRGEAGSTVALRHAEVLEDGELGTRPLRAARAADSYTLAGHGEEIWTPRFTFHGFRYAEVTGWPGELDPSDIVAEVLFSDMRRTGWFESSHEMLNRLHENVVWGMKGNFFYLPTDCPQRDERMGWTGDIQMFVPTASFLHDCNAFLSSWLVDLALEQEAAGGGVAFVVPDVLHSGRTPAAAWGDAATVVPWTLHQRFGDVEVLSRQYASMKAWVELLLDLAGERHLWEGGFQFGDWVDPDAPADEPARAKTDPDVVASAYLYHSTNLLAHTAELLGHSEDAARYAQESELIRQAWLAEYVTQGGRIVSDAQTAYALAITYGIARGELADRLGERLAWLARRDGYRISTGFVGTPLVNDALTSTGQLEAAGRMLLQTDCPSWLYSVTMGATTIWERWDSMLPDGSINPGEMTSFNHYALGAVADWMHRVVAGLAAEEPGYKKIRIAPRPIAGLEWAKARHDGPYGMIEVGWKRDGDTVRVSAVVPPNSSAVVDLPGLAALEVGSGRHEWTFEASIDRRRAAHVTRDTALAEIIDDPEAHAAVLEGFDSVSPEVGNDFRRRTRWIPNQALHSTFSLVSPRAAEKVMEKVEALNLARGFGRAE